MKYITLRPCSMANGTSKWPNIITDVQLSIKNYAFCTIWYSKNIIWMCLNGGGCFLWKLCCHWLKGLQQRQIAIVTQGSGCRVLSPRFTLQCHVMSRPVLPGSGSGDSQGSQWPPGRPQVGPGRWLPERCLPDRIASPQSIPFIQYVHIRCCMTSPAKLADDLSSEARGPKARPSSCSISQGLHLAHNKPE